MMVQDEDSNPDRDPEEGLAGTVAAPDDSPSPLLDFFGQVTAAAALLLIILTCVVIGARTGSERMRLRNTENQIAAAQREIHMLQQEFETRSNFAQLERWNGDTLRLSVPQTEQYITTLPQLNHNPAKHTRPPS